MIAAVWWAHLIAWTLILSALTALVTVLVRLDQAMEADRQELVEQRHARRLWRWEQFEAGRNAEEINREWPPAAANPLDICSQMCYNYLVQEGKPGGRSNIMGQGWHGVDWTGEHVAAAFDADGWLSVRTYGDFDTGPVVQLNPEQVADLLAVLNAATVAV